MTWKFSAVLTACAVVTLGALAIVGCENTSNGTVITVTPSKVELSGDVVTEVFTASPASDKTTLFLPLQWKVSDATLGVIDGAGWTAVYRRTGNVGVNVITVSDQAESDGTAVVTQR